MLPLSENALDELIAREHERSAPPLTEWGSLAERLRAEGLIRGTNPERSLVSRYWMQAAAALVLMSGGIAAGRISTGAPLLRGATIAVNSESPSAAQSSSPDASYSSVRPDAGAALASTTAAQEFRTPEDAWAVLNRAGEEYQRASAYLSASNVEVPMPQSPSTYRTRLAALDNVMSDMRVALKEAPQDPVINQYYLATVGAREATLRQLGGTLPAGARLNRF